MIFSLAQRKTLQETIEAAVPGMKDCYHKQLLLVILALVRDLSEAETGMNANRLEKPDSNRGYGFVRELQKTFEEFRVLAGNQVDGISIQHFTVLAENMKMMSESLFLLRDHLFKAQQEAMNKDMLQ